MSRGFFGCQAVAPHMEERAAFALRERLFDAGVQRVEVPEIRE